MRSLCAAALVSVLYSIGSTFPAEADWQYTKWNMTRAQVIAAAEGEARAVRGTPDQRVRDFDLGAEGSYSAEGFRFKNEFYFNKSGQLRLVRLLLRQGGCADLQKKLYSIYGRAAKKSDVVDTTIVIWRDTAKRNQVQFTFGPEPDDCLVLYEPLQHSQGRGL